MNKISPKNLPGFWELYRRVIYRDFTVQNNLFFSEVSPKKKRVMMYIISNLLFIVAFFFYALSSLNGILVSINIASQFKLDYNPLGMHDLDIGRGSFNFSTIGVSLISLILYFILISLLNIKRGSKYLVESEVKMTNGQWKSYDKRICIKDGIIKIKDNQTRSKKEKILSICQMRKIFNSKKTKIFKCVKFISINTADNCAKGSTIESSTLNIEYEGQGIEFDPEKFKSE